MVHEFNFITKSVHNAHMIVEDSFKELKDTACSEGTESNDSTKVTRGTRVIRHPHNTLFLHTAGMTLVSTLD